MRSDCIKPHPRTRWIVVAVMTEWVNGSCCCYQDALDFLFSVLTTSMHLSTVQKKNAMGDQEKNASCCSSLSSCSSQHSWYYGAFSDVNQYCANVETNRLLRCFFLATLVAASVVVVLGRFFLAVSEESTDCAYCSGIYCACCSTVVVDPTAA